MQRLKHALRKKVPKTVNNVLSVLNTLLRTVVEWDSVEQMPCTIRLLPVPKTSASFHDFDDFEWLVDTARETDWQTHLVVLFGGEAGLRCGEILALERTDVDLDKRQLCVQRSEWQGHVTAGEVRASTYLPNMAWAAILNGGVTGWRLGV